MDDHEVPEKSASDGGGADTGAKRAANEPSAGEEQHEGREPGIVIEDGDLLLAFSPEELPTMQWPDIDAELARFEQEQEADAAPQASSPLQGLEEAMSWLEELAAGQGTPIDEMPTLVTAQPVEEAVGEPSAVDRKENRVPAQQETTAVSMDSDPMAWLEQLAVDQSSPLEELPSVADRLLASEIASQTEIAPDSTINNPIDIEQALAYLEKLATSEGATLSTAEVETNLASEPLDFALDALDRLLLAEMAAMQTAESEPSPDQLQEVVLGPQQEAEQKLPQGSLDELSVNMPDDPQQALRWLSDLGIESDESFDVVTEADTVGSAETPETVEPEKVVGKVAAPAGPAEQNAANDDTDALAEMPDDPDEAMAWMEGLATRAADKPKEVQEAVQPDAATDDKNVSSMDVDELEAAEAALDGGDTATALEHLRKLIDGGAIDERLFELLETSIERRGESPQLLRLLGDAYMQVGDVDKAVATYRRGFDHI
ncbi:MAG: hypothetical protein ACK2UK_20225 [Candidatus Promineifilaceae bacterium]